MSYLNIPLVKTYLSEALFNNLIDDDGNGTTDDNIPVMDIIFDAVDGKININLEPYYNTAQMEQENPKTLRSIALVICSYMMHYRHPNYNTNFLNDGYKDAIETLHRIREGKAQLVPAGHSNAPGYHAGGVGQPSTLSRPTTNKYIGLLEKYKCCYLCWL